MCVAPRFPLSINLNFGLTRPWRQAPKRINIELVNGSDHFATIHLPLENVGTGLFEWVVVPRNDGYTSVGLSLTPLLTPLNFGANRLVKAR
jgi:hypothetical protein